MLLLVWGCSAARADLMIDVTFVDTVAGSWDDTRRGVVNQAIADWQQVLTGISDGAVGSTSASIHFTADFTSAGATYLGLMQSNYVAFPGDNVRPWSTGVVHQLHFNADFLNGANRLWFDPTPSDAGTDKAFPDWDALTVARHEMGHMLGFTGIFVDDFVNTNQSPWTSLIVNDVFDPGGLNVAMEPDDVSHVLANNLLMDRSLSNAEGRIAISSLEAQMLSKAYGYTLAAVPEPGSWCLLLAAMVPAGIYWRCRRSKV
jgi:hypothetical protein